MAKPQTSEPAGDKPAESVPVLVDAGAAADLLVAQAEAADAAEGKGEEVADAAPVAAAKPRPIFEVAPGKSVTTLRGTLHEGEEIKAEWFPGSRLGEKLRTMAGLVRDGSVLVNEGPGA